MQTKPDILSNSKKAARKPKSGIALVLVLAFLVLITGLVLAFFSSVTTELTGAKSYADETTTKQLSDSAVQLVMGSVATATSQGPTVAWASQPGMIRTYSSSGVPANCYKLYSSPNLVAAAAAAAPYFDPTTDLPSYSTWSGQPALFTDINSPVSTSSGFAEFPIVDGNAIQTLTKDPTGATVPAYLGYDANNDGLPDVQGFSVTPGSYVSYNSANPLSPANTPVPMPVQWIYVLKDGTLTAPTGIDSTGKIANWSSAAAALQPGSTNPIVGRIAYWTDDETSKVNINTAGQGTYWDTPHFYSSSLAGGTVTGATASGFPDYAYAAFQPAEYEFQRYPGHPAQVALSPIFSTATGQAMAGITPRLVWGGSQGGTVWAGGSTAQINLSSALRMPLYASADELLFSGSASNPRSVNVVSSTSSTPLTQAQLEQAKFFITANSRAPEVNLFDKPRVCMWPISSDLITNPSPSPYTTAHDRLVAFCSTLRKDLGTGEYPFYFQRSNSQSSTYDYTSIARNPILYGYLHNLMATPVPGFSASTGTGLTFAAKYPVPVGSTTGAADSDQILTEIFDYIRCTNLSDPNLGGIPTSNENGGTGTAWAKGTYQYANYENTGTGIGDTYSGQVMPIQIPLNGTVGQSPLNATMGFGRYYTVKDVSMIFACTGDGRDGPMPSPPPVPPAPSATIYQQSNDKTTNQYSATYNPSLAGQSLTTTQKRFQMALLLNYFLPSPGQLKCGPDMLVRITGLDQISITGATNIDGGSLFSAANPPTSSGWVAKLMATNMNGWNPVDAVLKYRYQVTQHRSPLYIRPNYANVTNGRIIYPFISHAFTLPAGSAMSLAAPVTLTIEIFQAKGAYDSNDTSSSNGGPLSSTYIATGAPTYNAITSDLTNRIQTITVTFPAGTFPQPTLAAPASGDYVYGLAKGPTPAATSPWGAWGFDGRIASPLTNGPLQAAALIAQSNNTAACYDTVRTVSVTTGDVRPVAASNVVPLGMYSGGSNYGSTTISSIHYFSDNVTPTGAVTGQMANGIYGVSAFCPPNTNSNYCLYGDWDGPDVRAGGNVNDGSFINKPDEGDNQTIGSGGTSYIPYYGYSESTTTNLNLYTPNRLMPSPGMLGSLPTRVQQNIATNGVGGSWQTLLFRPQPTHPNVAVPATGPPYTTIPDHLLMDLFWMPVVEPYALSEPFSTAGKINMNYQLIPFSPYMTRNTGMVALLKNNMIAARPATLDQAPAADNFRLAINPSEIGGTLQQFKNKFSTTGDIFRSPTQICDMDLVPFTDPTGAAQTWSTSWGSTFWSTNANTGDNLRERPYTNIYADLTTKSNTYTVHFRVQSLRKVPASNAAQWDDTRDQMVSEYRGSSVVERYIDANDTTLPDFALPANSAYSLESYNDSNGNPHTAYKFRVVSTKQFAP